MCPPECVSTPLTTDLVRVLIDLVQPPIDPFERRLGDDVRSPLKEERDAICEAVDVDARLGEEIEGGDNNYTKQTHTTASCNIPASSTVIFS